MVKARAAGRGGGSAIERSGVSRMLLPMLAEKCDEWLLPELWERCELCDRWEL